MRFCRSCYATLADDEAVCPACGAPWLERKGIGEIVSKEPTLRQPPHMVRPEEKLGPAENIHEARRQTSTPVETQRIRTGKVSTASIRSHIASSNLSSLRLGPIISLIGMTLFASYILWQHVIHTEVAVYFMDDAFYRSILSELRVHPTDYYSITDRLSRQSFTGNAPFVSYFPLMFYIWLLVPNVGDIKWLYLVFALAGTIASYFTVYSVTKQSLVALLSAAWMAYFLETPYYLMLEYWAISVFLIGLAFFVMKRHGCAAVAIGLAALIREVFAPFMLIASLYYLAASWKEWWPTVFHFFTGRRIETLKTLRYTETRKMMEAYVWFAATCGVGLLYYLNGLPLTRNFAFFLNEPVHHALRFQPEVITLLFVWYLRNPPIPVLAIALALIGMTFLRKDQRPIMYASFAALPLLMLLGVVRPPFELPLRGDNVPRYAAMSIAMVNLFWLTGPFKICERIYHMMHPLSQRTP